MSQWRSDLGGVDELVERVSRMVLVELTNGGKRDLKGMRLNELEDELFDVVDEISQGVVASLLQRQAEALRRQTHFCPSCRRELVPKPPQPRQLQLRRGVAHWDEPVWRCPSCRRDFFPSVGGDGLCGRGGV